MSIGLQSRNNYAAIVRIVNPAGYLVEREHLDIRPTLTAISFPDNQQFTPQLTDNWSRIAWKRLGNGRYWWIIADFSQIIDPFTDLYPTTKTQYLTQLTAAVPSGSVNQIQVANPNAVHMGDNLLIQNLNPSSLTSFNCSVLEVDAATGIVKFTPVTCPSPGIPYQLSRVSKVTQVPPTLTCPSPHQAFFQALNFSNPLNVAVA